MNEHHAPDGFLRSLAETIAWCEPRVNVTDSKRCLRSTDLKPCYRVYHGPDEDGDVWVDLAMIAEVEVKRSALLTRWRGAPVAPSTDFAGGRLLLHLIEQSNHNGLTADETSYFLDNNDTPPWDTWVQGYEPGSGSYPFLISWVPPEFIAKIQAAIEVECMGMLGWADCPEAWSGRWFDSASVPSWLRELSASR
jgi:hypothetical protein